jgi:hypothetical protein
MLPAAKRRVGAPRNSADIVRRLALKLPDAVEQPHFDFPSFRVRGRIFATARLNQPLAMLKLPVEVQQAMLVEHPEAFSLPPGAWGRNGATFVDTSQVDRALLADLLLTAWANVAPKTLATRHADRLKRA